MNRKPPKFNCGNCLFFHKHLKTVKENPYGQCRFSPPVLADNEYKFFPAGWAFPEMLEYHWCGQHKHRLKSIREPKPEKPKIS